ncbi:hypothetical protein FRX31_029116 [Thalictrum thalictroides]|uniref:Uncharacterized protein n=1 Tax=Thalictrum thalictroides TaxID=46969 RepID=A0A7J6VAP2_THATH|nr:hypothetical protein FRX31_029116 [Thalictrum thalictroides]
MVSQDSCKILVTFKNLKASKPQRWLSSVDFCFHPQPLTSITSNNNSTTPTQLNFVQFLLAFPPVLPCLSSPFSLVQNKLHIFISHSPQWQDNQLFLLWGVLLNICLQI